MGTLLAANNKKLSCVFPGAIVHIPPTATWLSIFPQDSQFALTKEVHRNLTMLRIVSMSSETFTFVFSLRINPAAVVLNVVKQ